MLFIDHPYATTCAIEFFSWPFIGASQDAGHPRWIRALHTHVFFQLSSADATTVAQVLDGGKSLAERLKNLPQRHFIVKSGADHWREGMVPTVEDVETNFADLLSRSRALHARPRDLIEHEIRERHAALTHTTDEVLHDWN